MCSAAERKPREPRIRWKRAMYSRLLLAVSPESSCESAATTASGSNAWVVLAEFVLSSKQRKSAIHLFTAGLLSLEWRGACYHKRFCRGGTPWPPLQKRFVTSGGLSDG